MNAFQEALPQKRMSAGCLFFDAQNRILLVNPTYKTQWEIPGGIVEKNESPLQACIREIQEELSLTVQLKRLLCIDYSPASDTRTESLSFIFEGSTLSTAQIADIKLAPKELSEYRFCTPDQVTTLLNERVGQRVMQCLSIIHTNQTCYLEKRNRVF